MNFKRTKILATVALAALMGMVSVSTQSHAAAVTPTVNATITTNSAITVADGADMAFGTWFVIFRNADAFSILLTPAGVISTVGLGGGAGDSQAVNTLVAPAQGTVTVSLPAGINGIQVNMQRTAEVDFPDAGLTLANITYDTATEAPTVMLAATNYPVTVVTGGTPETVSFGAEIQVTATPADLTHTASYQVSFAY